MSSNFSTITLADLPVGTRVMICEGMFRGLKGRITKNPSPILPFGVDVEFDGFGRNACPISPHNLKLNYRIKADGQLEGRGAA